MTYLAEVVHGLLEDAHAGGRLVGHGGHAVGGLEGGALDHGLFFPEEERGRGQSEGREKGEEGEEGICHGR